MGVVCEQPHRSKKHNLNRSQIEITNNTYSITSSVNYPNKEYSSDDIYPPFDTKTETNNNNMSNIALKLHNEYREKYGAKKLELNDELIDLAQKYSEKCAMTDSEDHCPFLYEGRPIGENIEVLDKTKFDVSKICRKWYEEKNEFNFGELVYQSECRHFTQMIWKDSIYVGFGLSTSNTGQNYFVAYYFPAGNIFDKFKTNLSEKKKSHNK